MAAWRQPCADERCLGEHDSNLILVPSFRPCGARTALNFDCQHPQEMIG